MSIQVRGNRLQVKAAQSGIVQRWWNSAGAGYVVGDDGLSYYVPLSALPNGYTSLKVGQQVRFDSPDGETAVVTALLG